MAVCWRCLRSAAAAPSPDALLNAAREGQTTAWKLHCAMAPTPTQPSPMARAPCTLRWSAMMRALPALCSRAAPTCAPPRTCRSRHCSSPATMAMRRSCRCCSLPRPIANARDLAGETMLMAAARGGSAGGHPRCCCRPAQSATRVMWNFAQTALHLAARAGNEACRARADRGRRQRDGAHARRPGAAVPPHRRHAGQGRGEIPRLAARARRFPAARRHCTSPRATAISKWCVCCWMPARRSMIATRTTSRRCCSRPATIASPWRDC